MEGDVNKGALDAGKQDKVAYPKEEWWRLQMQYKKRWKRTTKFNNFSKLEFNRFSVRRDYSRVRNRGGKRKAQKPSISPDFQIKRQSVL